MELFSLLILQLLGLVFLLFAFLFLARSLRQFFLTKNTVILIKPAKSLQTGGIYQFSRNPMYLGLVFAYLGLTCFLGNWWNLLLLPFLILLVQEYVIKKEERYLKEEFG